MEVELMPLSFMALLEIIGTGTESMLPYTLYLNN